MSSIQASQMRSATDLLIAVQGEKTGVQYAPAKSPAFDWPGCVVGGEQGGIEENFTSGDLVKVIRRTVSGPASELVKRGVTGLDREASVIVAGTAYSIDMLTSRFGPELVRLDLTRRPIARHQDMEDRSSVR
jgi:hypothetical protein